MNITDCAVCGQGIVGGYEAGDRADFALHLQACALKVQVRIADALESMVENGLLMRMQGRVPTSAPERFQNGGE